VEALLLSEAAGTAIDLQHTVPILIDMVCTYGAMITVCESAADSGVRSVRAPIYNESGSAQVRHSVRSQCYHDAYLCSGSLDLSATTDGHTCDMYS
jgi:hypothetical protein